MAGTPLSIFISYSRTDSQLVDRLEVDLKARGFYVWVDRRKIEPGQHFREEIQKAIDRCQITLVVLSPEAMASKYVRQEYEYADEQNKPIIPLNWRTTKVSPTLNGIHWANFQSSYDQGFNELLTALSHFIIESEPVQETPQPPPLPKFGTKERLRTGILIGVTLVILLAGSLGVGALFRQSPRQPAGIDPRVTPTFTPDPTSTQASCGGVDLAHAADRTITVNDPDGLRNETSSGQQSFDNQVREAFADYSNRTASLVQVYGGGINPQTGQSFAHNAIDALKLLEDQNILFGSKYTLFQNFWDGNIGNNDIRMSIVFYYEQCPPTYNSGDPYH